MSTRMPEGDISATATTEPATIEPNSQEPPGDQSARAISSLLARGKLVPIVAPAFFAVLFTVYAFWLGSDFLDANARILDLHQNAPVLLIALGLTVCLIAGQFDLSVASMATLTSFLSLGLVSQQGWPIELALVGCVGAAIVGGLLNAFLVVRLQVNAFIATLGAGGVFLGLSSVYAGGSSLIPDPSIDKGTLPSWFTGPDSFASFTTKVPGPVFALVAVTMVVCLFLVGWERSQRSGTQIAIAAASALLGVAVGIVALLGTVEIPWTVLVLFVVSIVLWVMMRYTVLGRHLYALGGNPASARLAGVNVERSTAVVFVVAAVLAALAGVVLAGNQGAASPGGATGYLLPAFAAGFLSTVLFASGRFHVWGALLGGYLIVTVSQGLVTGGVPFTWNEVVNGLVLIGAVSFQSYFAGARRRTSRGRSPRET